jgi:hypothetical protein
VTSAGLLPRQPVSVRRHRSTMASTRQAWRTSVPDRISGGEADDAIIVIGSEDLRIVMLTQAHRNARFAGVRTTVRLDDDVAAAVDGLRRDRGLGLSEALNELVRAGLQAPVPRARFQQRTADLGVGVDVRNVAETLELAEGPAHR